MVTSIWLALLGFATAVPVSAAAIKYAGVNLAGAEFGTAGAGAALPGANNVQYGYPNQTEVDYFRSKGMNIIRLPFRWERLQQSMNAEFDVAESNRFHTFVSATTAKSVYVIIEPHNFQRYYPDITDFNTMQSGSVGLVGSVVPDSAFTDFWSRLATLYKTNDHVIFNLMNEPNAVPTAQLLASENAAVAAIRTAGAKNLILVPGNRWTGAWTWLNSDGLGQANSQAMLNIVDPANNYAFDVHQYLDYDGSGTHTNIGPTSTTSDPNIGATRLAGFTQWLKNNNRKGFLGEFAVANSTIGGWIGDEAISNMLTHIQANADVWLGWAWWAAGPRWGNYMFTLERTGGGADRPAMAILRNFIPAPAPSLQITAANQFQFTMQPGFIFQPQGSPDLTEGSWTNYGSAIVGTNQTATVTIAVGTDSSGFYRVRVNRTP